jgi:DNA polymerase III subunit gamma/tau
MSGSSLFADMSSGPNGTNEPAAESSEQPSASTPARQVMRTQSLYRRYRPQTFEDDELVGQDRIVRTLKNAILLDRIAHAYLFCGPRGTGKTTTARLLAKAVNCLAPDPSSRPCNECSACTAISGWSTTDVIEIDAASNRGIDDIRELRERVKFAPTQLGTKFYIIDEAHQITGPAANAFLKTLEEPPPHTKFILATTDPEELLPTIVSRCQRFDFRRIPNEAIIQRLMTVAESEALPIDAEATELIARHAGGSLRDALGLLDQLSVFVEAGTDQGPGRITADGVRELLGISRNEQIERIVRALVDRDTSTALASVNAAIDEGHDPRQINRQLVQYLRVLLIERAGGHSDADETAKAIANQFDLSRLAALAKLFGDIDFRIKKSTLPQLPLEIALVEATLPVDETDRVREPRSAQTASGERSALNPERAPISYDQARPAPRPVQPIRETGPETRRPAAESSESQPQPASVPLTPTQPPQNAVPNEPGVPAANLSLDQIADLWSQVRFEVKARNRRVEALLSSVDPAAIVGDLVVLVAAYPFHRDKLNTDEAKTIVEEVMTRVLRQPVRVETVLKGEESSFRSAGSRTPPSPHQAEWKRERESASPQPEPIEPPEEPEPTEGTDRLVTAAKNIFDAEEVRR